MRTCEARYGRSAARPCCSQHSRWRSRGGASFCHEEVASRRRRSPTARPAAQEVGFGGPATSKTVDARGAIAGSGEARSRRSDRQAVGWIVGEVVAEELRAKMRLHGLDLRPRWLVRGRSAGIPFSSMPSRCRPLPLGLTSQPRAMIGAESPAQRTIAARCPEATQESPLG